MIELHSQTSADTRVIGARIGQILRPGDVVLLHGDLGAGKTTFTQGLAEGLGIRALVSSPTFTLVQEYLGGRLPLFHFDPYRLHSPEEIAGLGFDEYLERSGVVVVEWAERLGWLAPPDALRVAIHLGAGDERTIAMTATGPHSDELVDLFQSDPC